MGARGKKRVRANGEVASGKQRVTRAPRSVPIVAPEEVREGLGLLNTALQNAGATDVDSPAGDAAYRTAQAALQARYPRMHADAILWRATHLHSLLGWDEFREAHCDDGALPTDTMIEVAATIETYGDERSFDIDYFEDLLGLESGTETLGQE